ncbi:MAG: response regulator [Planctomycetes bacterium]|nr:response regulator [Planctomycetota bacterium]
MRRDAVILVAENNDEHFSLISKNLQRTSLRNEIVRFTDGQQVLDFLLKRQAGEWEYAERYILLLNIDMPKVSGIEVLKAVKADTTLKKMPVIMLADTEDYKTIGQCHDLGCSIYIIKPSEEDRFIEVIQKAGAFLLSVEVPQINKLS